MDNSVILGKYNNSCVNKKACTDLIAGGEIFVDHCSSIEEGVTILGKNSIYQLNKDKKYHNNLDTQCAHTCTSALQCL